MPEFIETTIDLKNKQLAELEMVLAGYEDCAPGHDYGPTVRSHELIHFVTSGHGRLYIDGAVLTARAGDAFLIPSDMVSYYKADMEDPWHYAWIGFTGVRASGFMQQLVRVADSGYILHDLDTEKYAGLLKKVCDLQSASLPDYLMAQSVLLEVLSHLARDLSAGFADQPVPLLVEKIKFFMDVKFTEKTPVGEIAARFGIHPNYMTRIFKEKYDITPKKYLLSLKLKKAAHLLTASDLPVALIASSVGFDDQAAFSKAFKQMYGKAPITFRGRGV